MGASDGWEVWRQKGGRRGGPVGAMEHGGGKARHGWLGVDMKVPVHLIGSPAADETNPVAIHTRAEEGRGSAGPGGAGREERRGKAQGRSHGGGSKAEQSRDGGGKNIGPAAVVVVSVERGIGAGMV